MQRCKGCCFTPSTNPASTCEHWSGGIFIHQFLCASYLWGVMSSVPGHQTWSVTYCCNTSTISNVSCWTEVHLHTSLCVNFIGDIHGCIIWCRQLQQTLTNCFLSNFFLSKSHFLQSNIYRQGSIKKVCPEKKKEIRRWSARNMTVWAMRRKKRKGKKLWVGILAGKFPIYRVHNSWIPSSSCWGIRVRDRNIGTE